nr:DUF3592 domain-containing protein [Cellvibrio fibrivorans]
MRYSQTAVEHNVMHHSEGLSLNFQLLGGIFFMALSLAMFFHSVRELNKAKSSINWVKTLGKIKQVRLYGVRIVNGSRKNAETLDLEYEYIANEKSYKSSRIAFYTLHFPDSYNFSLGKIVGENINVYYNPENHGESVLIVGAQSGKEFSGHYLSIICFIIGVITLIFSF